MKPSAALLAYIAALNRFEEHPLSGSARQDFRLAADTFDQAIYDMARRAHLGLPMVDEPRKKRGT